MVEDIRKGIKENDIMVFVIPNKDYRTALVKIAKALSKLHKKICYISLNKPHKALLKEFEKNGIEHNKFLFIDCVGKGPSEGVLYVSSPKALTEMNITINKALARGIESNLFDSLSTLLIYEQPSTVIKFTHSVISSFRNKGIKAVFTCLKGDAKSELIKDLSMFVDNVVELG
jgi:hypothetical protein